MKSSQSIHKRLMHNMKFLSCRTLDKTKESAMWSGGVMRHRQIDYYLVSYDNK